MEESKIIEEVLEVLGKGKSDEEIRDMRSEIEDSLEINGDTATFEADGDEYKLIEDEDAAEKMAVDEIKDFLDTEGPQFFNQDFIKEHLYVGDTDKRLIAGDEADAYLEGISDDEERILDEAEMTDEFEAAERDNERASILQKAKDKIHDEHYKEVYDRLERDPVDYFAEFHKDEAEAIEWATKQGLLNVDKNKAAEEAVNLDGWAHQLSRYDGEFEKTRSGMVFFREA